MPDHNLIHIFISRLNKLNVHYFVTGAVASIIYGEPRLTHDLDLVLAIDVNDVDTFTASFPLSEFYCPPPEIIHTEITRPQRGHFNLIHHATGFKADIYTAGEDKLHEWALNNRKQVDFESEIIWLAPIEYVILRKLQYFREGGSEKHLRDISGILEISSDQIDLKILKEKIKAMGLKEEWQKVARF